MIVLPSNPFLPPLHESLSCPIVTWNGTSKSKKLINLEQKNESILKGTLKEFLPVAHFTRIFMTTKDQHWQKTFSPPPHPPSPEVLGSCPPADQTLTENPGGSWEESWWGFVRLSPNIFWHFDVFKASKWVTVALKIHIYGFRTYLFFLVNIT